MARQFGPVRSLRQGPGGRDGYVGVAYDVELPGQELFFSHVHLHAGRPLCAASCPNWSTSSSASRSIRGQVFDLELPLDQAAEGYRAMDERRAIKALLCP